MSLKFKKSQTAQEYLVLAGVILVLLIPLLVVYSTRTGTIRSSNAGDAVDIIAGEAKKLTELGYGSTSSIILQVPEGVISSYIKETEIIIELIDQNITRAVTPLSGNFPTNPGTHYIDLFNNGSHILLTECGNNQLENLFEQCEPPTTFNPLGIDSICPTGSAQCGSIGSAKACKCVCSTNNDCPTDPFGLKYTCINGACQPTGTCGDGVITSPQEQCDPASPLPNNGCAPGLVCSTDDPACTCREEGAVGD